MRAGLRLRPLAGLMCLLFVGAACALAQSRQSGFYIRDRQLWRGRHRITIRAIEARKLAHPDTPQEVIIRTLHQIAEAGGNGVCFDLTGFRPDGGALSNESAAALGRVKDLISERWMHGICRVLRPDAPLDIQFRKAAVKTAAASLKGYDRLVYWIDVPDCAALVAEFRKQAPHLVVAAPEGGDINVVGAPLADNPEGPTLLAGAIPATPWEAIHFVLPESDESYLAMERTMADPVESRLWAPDNSVLTAEDRADGWIALFNGNTLEGWTVGDGDKDGFVVRNGAIELAGIGAGTLRARNRYDNFILRLEWRTGKGGNSGVLLRAPRAARASKIGLEFQLMGDYGKAPHKGGTGAIYDALAPPVYAAKPHGEWNTVEITLEGSRLKAVLNGQTLHDLDLQVDPDLSLRLRRGFIGLQDHRPNRRTSKPIHDGCYAAFRNIRIKPL